MTTHEQARDVLGKCQRLIHRIDARGGPVPGTEQQYAKAKAWVEGNLTMMDDAALGVVPLAVGAGVWALVAIGTAMAGWLSWQIRNQAVTTAGELLDTAATVGKVAMWSGLAWLGWQMFGPQRRSA